ncbi:DUF1203 domain-containing protein [uncultured Eudoraea sp.]|uniref:DUF1203 domain-containing protein n=1 Tax=uncultured Eudoraea sp. TaxID=1035614 RepID=UPI002619F94F|nr:DUF1203 domain-containing protein [uncultured Eudoraea sp.]
MNFKIQALKNQEFELLFQLSDFELEKLGIKRMIVDENPGYPCRVSLEDAKIGEEVILVPYDFHKTNSPYQSRGPIFVRKGIVTRVFENNEIPIMLNHRLLSYRGYDKYGFMKEAVTEKGENLKSVIENIFKNTEIEYIHIHNASPGCYNCEVRKVE